MKTKMIKIKLKDKMLSVYLPAAYQHLPASCIKEHAVLKMFIVVERVTRLSCHFVHEINRYVCDWLHCSTLQKHIENRNLDALQSANTNVDIFLK